MTHTANYTRRFQQPHRRFHAGATLSAALTLLILASHPARAEDFVWQGVGCTNAWFAFCNQGECSPGVTLRVNGWGRNACSPATPAVPAAGDRIFINAGLTLVQNGGASILQLNIPATSQLHMVNGVGLDLTGATQNNSGIIIVNSAGGFGASTLQFSANSSLTGSGVVRMSAANADAQVNTIGAAILTNAAGHSIAGRGQINANLVNNGFVSADVGSHVLNLISNNKTNNALMNALNGGFLDITGITITQGANGEIAANSATVRMQGGSTIIGGKITSPNSGVFSVENGTNTLTNILNEADLRIVNGRILQLSGTFTNNNRVLVNSAGGFGQTTLQILANLTMNGSGRIDMNAANADATLDTAAGITLTQASAHTIRGRGYLNANLVNNGLVSADVGGHVLYLRDKNKTNNATMQATNSSFLDIVGGENGILIDQIAGAKILADGGTVRLQGNATIVRGILETLNSGVIFVSEGTNTVQGMNNRADLRIVNGRTLRVIGNAFNNQLSVIVNNAGGFGPSTMLFDANVALNGSGIIHMNAANQDATLDTGMNFTVTQASTHTIRGRGHLNANLVNNGLVSADIGGHILHLRDKNKTNNATMKATDASFLDIVGITVNQGANGELLADGGTVRLQVNATVQGGKLRSTGSNFISIENGTNTLTNILNEADLRIVNGRTLQLNGTFTNNNRVLVNPAGGFGQSTLQILANLTLNGSGRIDMNAANADATLDTAAGITLTQASTHTIRGRGHLNANLVNNGLVSADIGGHILHLRDKNKTNNATMKATDASFLDIVGITVNQGANGELLADGGTVRLQGNATVQGGKLRSTGSNFISIENGTNTLQVVRNEADLRIRNGITLQIASSPFQNAGTVLVNTAGGFGVSTITFLDNTTLSASGSIILNAVNTEATLSVAANKTLTQAPAHTIRGRGTISIDSTGRLVNNGTIRADVGAHTLFISNGNRLDNRGTVAVNTSCTMTATGGYVQTAGNTNVNGTMNVNSGPMEIQDGILSGVGIINGTVVLSNNAQFSPGNSPGTLTINGNYTQGPDNSYLVEIAGRSAGQWDRVAVNGTSPNGVATLDGVLEVALLDGFQPQLGDRFIIMTHRARVGKFSEWVLPNAPDGTRWTVGYFPDRVVLSVTCTSDVNGDGSINDDDLLAILLAFGTDDKSADVNQDGIVNDIDLLLVLLAFGEACQ